MTDEREARLLQGLKICSDTQRHIDEWGRRKAALLDFVALFEDGRTITVGVACPPDKLDPVRGTFLARLCHPDAMRRAVLPKIVREPWWQRKRDLDDEGPAP
jgi:hypothetical protein